MVQTKDIKRYYSKTIQKKTSVVYNPVSEQVFEAVNVSQENQIISVGRLYHQKNQKMMIDAFDRIKNTYPDYKLVIYGEGPCREELEKYMTIHKGQKKFIWELVRIFVTRFLGFCRK